MHKVVDTENNLKNESINNSNNENNEKSISKCLCESKYDNLAKDEALNNDKNFDNNNVQAPNQFNNLSKDQKNEKKLSIFLEAIQEVSNVLLEEFIKVKEYFDLPKINITLFYSILDSYSLAGQLNHNQFISSMRKIFLIDAYAKENNTFSNTGYNTNTINSNINTPNIKKVDNNLCSGNSNYTANNIVPNPNPIPNISNINEQNSQNISKTKINNFHKIYKIIEEDNSLAQSSSNNLNVNITETNLKTGTHQNKSYFNNNALMENLKNEKNSLNDSIENENEASDYSLSRNNPTEKDNNNDKDIKNSSIEAKHQENFYLENDKIKQDNNPGKEEADKCSINSESDNANSESQRNERSQSLEEKISNKELEIINNYNDNEKEHQKINNQQNIILENYENKDEEIFVEISSSQLNQIDFNENNLQETPEKLGNNNINHINKNLNSNRNINCNISMSKEDFIKEDSSMLNLNMKISESSNISNANNVFQNINNNLNANFVNLSNLAYMNANNSNNMTNMNNMNANNILFFNMNKNSKMNLKVNAYKKLNAENLVHLNSNFNLLINKADKNNNNNINNLNNSLIYNNSSGKISIAEKSYSFFSNKKGNRLNMDTTEKISTLMKYFKLFFNKNYLFDFRFVFASMSMLFDSELEDMFKYIIKIYEEENLESEEEKNNSKNNGRNQSYASKGISFENLVDYVFNVFHFILYFSCELKKNETDNFLNNQIKLNDKTGEVSRLIPGDFIADQNKEYTPSSNIYKEPDKNFVNTNNSFEKQQSEEYLDSNLQNNNSDKRSSNSFAKNNIYHNDNKNFIQSENSIFNNFNHQNKKFEKKSGIKPNEYDEIKKKVLERFLESEDELREICDYIVFDIYEYNDKYIEDLLTLNDLVNYFKFILQI